MLPYLINIFAKPSHLHIILRDLFKSDNKIYSDKSHLRASMEWLCRTQDITSCGGSSGGYSVTPMDEGSKKSSGSEPRATHSYSKDP